MKNRCSRAFVALACAAIVAATTTYGQKISPKVDDSFNFAEHKKYMWRGNHLVTRQNPDINEVLDLKIVKTVNRELAAKGFVGVKEKPDFYIYYDGGGNSQLAAGGASEADPGPATTADLAPGFGLGNGPAIAPTTWMKVNGQIEFHIVPVGASKSVWETTYSKNFRDPDKALKDMDKEVNELVTKSFKGFPPKTKK
jgi:Domain of unknown function (DUF4136)